MALILRALVCLVVVGLAASRPPQQQSPPSSAPLGCDNAHCNRYDPKKLNVHLVPHTHDDVGWLKTVDQYFWGSRTDIQKAGVQYIIDSVVQSLQQNPDRKFIYVETAFFWMWWKLQSPQTQTRVKQLVNDGQLEFINGGWSMNDEAAAHYQSIVDQMTWGHRRLQDQFGQCGVPRIGWQIDPFGHSREQANLFAQMGFDGFFFARLDYADKTKREKDRSMELVWLGSDDLGNVSDIFTHAMEMGYGPPPGFNWDLANGGGDEPFIDDPESEDYNVDRIVDRFVKYAKSYSQVYPTNNVLFPMGTDFYYQDANMWFKNMDKLIKYVNTRQSEVNVFYSTPTCYLHGVQLANRTFTTKRDDFFPYASDEHSYWTGYFTSRPAIKRYEKVGNNFLQVCKQLDVLSGGNGANEDKVSGLREWMGVMQHHDAVSGTEKQHVANNYALKLYKNIEKCQQVVNKSLNVLIGGQTVVDQLFCNQLNVSACPLTEGRDQLAVTLYNPFGRWMTHKIRLPVTHKNYEVLHPTGKIQWSTVVPIAPEVLALKERVSKATDELVFEANAPPLGYNTYILRLKTNNNDDNDSQQQQPEEPTVTKITDKLSVKSLSNTIMFDNTGALSAVQLANGKVVDLKQKFEFYKAKPGDNKGADHRASGAYIMRTDGQTPELYKTPVTSELVNTSNFVEVRQRVTDYVWQVIRIWRDSDALEFDYVVGPIPVDDKVGKEIISRWETNLTTSSLVYTDANGRQMLERRRDFRPTWNMSVTEEVAENYYPVNSRIAIRDVKQDLQMTVLNDRSQGGASLKDGSLELMVHRRDLYDDAFGVGEALNEPGVDGKGLVIRGKFWLLLTSLADAADAHRDLAQRILSEPSLTFGKLGSTTPEDYLKKHKCQYTGLAKELPKNVHLLTVEQWKDSQLLVRLEHYYQTNESRQLSKPVTVSLRDMFAQFTVTEARETTLTGTLDVKALDQRLKWRTSDGDRDGGRYEPNRVAFDPTDLTVTLNPMEIRTFIVKTKSR